jgi:hypothetical protein
MKTFKVYFISSITGQVMIDTFRSHKLENIEKQVKTMYKERLVKIEEVK